MTLDVSGDVGSGTSPPMRQPITEAPRQFPAPENNSVNTKVAPRKFPGWNLEECTDSSSMKHALDKKAEPRQLQNEKQHASPLAHAIRLSM